MLRVNDKQLKFHFERFEFKYQLPLHLVEGIIPKLLKYMDWDPFTESLPERAYTVSSIYFDSSGLDCYYQKLAGIRNRKKIRVRFYDSHLSDDTPTFLEIKRKYDAVIVKDRVVVPFKDCYNIIYDNMIVVGKMDREKEVLEEFISTIRRNGMTPQIFIEYKRKPFISKIDPQFRVTIDYEIKTSKIYSLEKPVDNIRVTNGTAILEVKFNNSMPKWFHNFLQQYNLINTPYSKYCKSIEASVPSIITQDLISAHTDYGENK